MKSFRPAFFSACLPNPYPSKRPFRSLPAPFSENSELLKSVDAEDAARWIGGGRTPLACSRQDVKLRLVLAFSRKMSPSKMLRQPRENRKKAETSAKSST